MNSLAFLQFELSRAQARLAEYFGKMPEVPASDLTYLPPSRLTPKSTGRIFTPSMPIRNWAPTSGVPAPWSMNYGGYLIALGCALTSREAALQDSLAQRARNLYR
jgi:hypothetical protein